MFESATSHHYPQGNFMVNLVWVLFTLEKSAGRNFSGKTGKIPLDNVKLHKVKRYVLRLYLTQASQRESKHVSSPFMNTYTLGTSRRVTVLLSLRCF